MKKDYKKPSMTAIELQHMTRLLAGSGDVKEVRSNGWNNQEDVIIINSQGGGVSIFDR